MGFLGKFLKNMAIKKVTKKHFYQIFELIKCADPTLTMDRGTLTLKTIYMTAFGEPPPEKEFGDLYYHIVMLLTCRELSYDPTIPSLEDSELMMKTIQKEAKRSRKAFERCKEVLGRGKP